MKELYGVIFTHESGTVDEPRNTRVHMNQIEASSPMGAIRKAMANQTGELRDRLTEVTVGRASEIAMEWADWKRRNSPDPDINEPAKAAKDV